VSFRYLQSVGNNKQMLLGGRGGDEAVHFHEPDGFSSVGIMTAGLTGDFIIQSTSAPHI
jgi:hypothetical protein